MGRNTQIQASDNVTIGAWHFLPKSYYDQHQLRYQDKVEDAIFDKALADPTYETIIYFHGNALDRTAPWRVDLYKQLMNRFEHVHIIAIDYRGFGDSGSTPSESGLRLDALATLQWLNQRGVIRISLVPNHRISLIGHSLGTGVATTLAHDMNLSGHPPKSLILKAGYSSMTTLVFEYNVVPFFPILSPLKRLPVVQRWLLSRLNHKFDSLSKVQHVGCPLLIIYGLGDLEIPITNSLSLFKRALAVPDNYTLSDVVNQGLVEQINLPQEAIVYRSNSVVMVELKHGHHNNIGYFDITYESIRGILESK
ncbi:Alpha/Beta hydrolase protein [Choanephora cucurbitarum]|nr:Alpha/Beta hydrolase protein [Choanephora cucurbitarum]